MKKSLFLFCLNLSFSQTGHIQGIILSENLDTLAGANIAIDGTDIGTASLADGSFILNELEPGKYVINVNYIGFRQTSRTLYISEFSSANQATDNEYLKKMGIETDKDEDLIQKAPYHDDVEFILMPDPLGIEEITVAAAKIKQKITEAPSVVSLLNDRSIRRHVGVDNFNRLASFLKGVDVTYFGVQGAQINARGFDGAYSTRFRQYEDGIYVGELVSGQVYSVITGPPKESISKIEVLFGPQSALYGPDATQGLLNIIKKHPRENNQNEINISANSLSKYRLGGRYTNVFDKLAYDIVFEAASAQELEYGNNTGKTSSIFYATDENDDGDYDDLGDDGTWETDTLKSDYYADMDQNRLSLRSNFYYSITENSELSISLKNIYGEGYAMGSVGPMYTKSNYTNTLSAKYKFKQHSFRYTILSQNQSTIPRQNLARYQVDHPEQSWDDAIDGFEADSMFWNLEFNSLDHFVDCQWNTYFSSYLQIVAGFDYEYKDPNTNRTAINDDGYDYFTREIKGEDIKESRYGVYGQLMTDYFPIFEITASLRYDNHEHYGDMISPRFSIVKDNFFNGSLKFIAGRAFKAPTILERNLYSGIVDAATGSTPFPWAIQGIAMGNNDGFTRYDFKDVGNGTWDQWIDINGNGIVDLDQDLFEIFIDADYNNESTGIAPGWTNEIIAACTEYDANGDGVGDGIFQETTGYCGNGEWHNMDLNGDGDVFDLVEIAEGVIVPESEPWWELDGNGIYDSGDILADSMVLAPLDLEKFTSFEIAYIGMINKNTLLDVNAYYGTYENFKTPLMEQGITGPWFLNDDMRTTLPFYTRQINRGNEILGGHPLTEPNQYTYVQTYQSLPIEINYLGIDLGLKYMNENLEFYSNISYFDDSDLTDKRDKAEKYEKYKQDPIEYVDYSDLGKYKNFLNVHSNTSNLKYNISITLIEPIINNLDVSVMLKGNTPYDFVSGVFQATKNGEGESYDPIEGYKVDGGQVGGGVYVDLNLNYQIDYYTNFGLGIKNLFESSTVSFPMSPYIPRSYVIEIGYKF